jgi:hypothetical protein
MGGVEHWFSVQVMAQSQYLQLWLLVLVSESPPKQNPSGNTEPISVCHL